MKYKRILTGKEVEAITFDECMEYGKSHGANIVKGVPQSFEYYGCTVTHKNNECYMISTASKMFKFEKQDMLVINSEMIYSCDAYMFEKMYSKMKIE